jgi:membrane-associated phospholipid phosphatase
MKKIITLLLVSFVVTTRLFAQTETNAGNWKTWFIGSGKAYSPPPPPDYKQEIATVIAVQQNPSVAAMQQVQFWNAGAPGYRWQQLIGKLWQNDTSHNGALANLLVGVATYDATVVAWNAKYAYKRPRPYEADGRIKSFSVKTGTPSYPCEHSVAAGVAVAVISYFYPKMADSANRMAERLMASRVLAGAAFPGDTRAGFELGKKIAQKEIEHTKDYVPTTPWDGKMPQQAGMWKGRPMLPLGGKSKTVVLESASQFRPGPPPDFAKDMEELRKFKPGFSSTANAFIFAATSYWEDLLHKKIFEYNIHLDAPRAARIYAIVSIGSYDGFTSCWDAKYAYWGTRPDQYDTSFHPVLYFTPPFPGYPSGHAMLGSVVAELYAYFFPAEADYFRQKARDGAESRFQGGIHFRTDNEVGVEMGKKVAKAILEKVEREKR